ncbi:hypothetical protein lerEdw1_010894 [Lerista edwardsae]|nr:hypothetical protein lerEdw1_010894 [Lerista edwardsae]
MEKLWRHYRKFLTWLWAILQWIHFGITGRLKQIAEQQSATKPWPQAGAPQKTHKNHIRQLLCDNPACKVCERAAEEATQFLYSQGADSHVPAGLSPESRTELPVLHGAFFERGRREETVRVAEHAARDWKEGRHWVLNRDSEKEDIFSLSSTTITTSVTTWTESSSGLSEAAACHHLKDFRSKQQKGGRGHSQEAFAETRHRKRVDVTTVLTVQRDVVSRAKIRAARLLAGPRRTRAIHFTPQKILFLEDAEIANLESHLVGKRVHHLLGLPLALSRSLRSFVPPAPSSAPRRRFREVDVVTSPQVLPFVATDASTSWVDLKVKKMVQLKRWQLPWRVQASPRYMKPPPQLREKPPSAFQKPRPNQDPEPPFLGLRQRKDFESHVLGQAQRPSWKLGRAATHLQGAGEARVAAQRLPSFGPALTEHPEADTTYYTAAHRRHLPRWIQRALKKSLPPESLLQAEGSKWEAQTPQTLQAAPEQAPREAEALPRNRLRQVSDSAQILPDEASSLLDFHIRQKRIQHAWGLPVTVQKSLRAFALPPPKPSPGSPKARAAALVAETGKGSVTVQTPQYAGHVITSSLPFLSTETIDALESHMRNRAAKHKWKLPKVIQDSLRVFIPLQSEPPEKQKETISPPKGQVATEVSEVPALLPPEQEPTFFPREIQDLLEFHIQHKKMQHAWGLPSTVLRSLKVFAPFPRGPEKHTPAAEKATTAQMLPWAREDVSITTRSLLFLSSDTKEHLESHMRRIIAEHRWQLPRRVKKPLKAFRPAVSPPAESGPPTPPWLPPDSESLQDSPTEPQLETESSVRTFQATREASAERAEQEQPSPTSPISAGTHSAERAAGLPFLTLAARRELELHIQRKKIQHEWGLPKAIQRSLQAFAPLPPDPPQRRQSAQGGSLAARSPQNTLVGAQEPWEEQEVKAAAQELHCLDQGTTDALEAHVRTLIAEHKWRLSGRLQKSVKPFVLAASRPPAGGPEEQGVLSTYYHDMTMSVAGIPPQTEAEEEAPSGPEEFPRYRSELFYNIDPWVEAMHRGSPEPIMSRNVATVGGAFEAPVIGSEATGQTMNHGRLTATSMVSGESVYTRPTLGPPLLTDETLDLLESHIRNRKLQHLLGLPTIVQKSVRKFAPTYSEPSVKRGLPATLSQGAGEAGGAAQRLPSFDPSLMEHLEAHMRRRIAAHWWHLPRRVQRALKKPLPPEPHSQAEGSKEQAQTRPDPRNQTLQAAPEQAPREAEDLPRNRLHQVKDSAQLLPDEASSLLDFHIRQRRIQHAWGLPVTVQKSLRAFARPPPKPSPRSPKASALVTGRGKGSVAGQTRPPAVHVITLPQDLPFLSRDTVDCLEGHTRSRAAKHRWKIPKLIRDLLRVFVPPQFEPPEKQKRNTHPRKRKAATRACAKVSTLLPPEQEPAFLPRESRDLLEFHIALKKIQHAWRLPSMVLRSLKVFAPFPLGPEKHTPAAEKATTSAGGDMSITTRSPLFLSSDTKEHLESHMRSAVAEHRWQLPKRVKKSLKAFRPAVSSPAESGPPTQPWLPPDSESLQGSPTEPQLETESSVRTFQATREVSAKRAELEQPSPTSPISAGTRSAERAAGLPFLTLAAERELELHIQRKKIQHEWGLPKAIQRSLQAFAPLPPDPPQRRQSAQGGSLAARSPQNTLVGAQEPWGVQEVKAAAQELHCLDQGTTDALEAHVRTLIAEHKWRLPRLLQKSVKPFVLAASRPPAGGPEEQGVLSTCYHDMPMSVAGIPLQTGTEVEAPSSSEELPRYRSELVCRIGPYGGPSSWQAAEDPLLCPAAEPQHSTETTGSGGGWEAGGAASRSGPLQKQPLQRSSLYVCLKKATSEPHLRASVKVQETGVPPVSPFQPLHNEYVDKTIYRSQTFPGSQRAASPSGRIPQTVPGRDPVQRSSNGISREPECGIQRTPASSQSPPRTCPRQGSTSSLCSDTGQRWWQQEKEDSGEGPAKAGDDESQSVSSSSSGESTKEAPLPEQEADASAAQQHRTPTSCTGLSSSTECSHVDESPSASEGTVPLHYRQAGGGRHGRGITKLQRRGSLLGWSRGSREALPCQAPEDGAAANISVETTFQGDPAHGCQPQTGRADGGGAQVPQSPGGVSQFSTECEGEEVGDWDGEEAAAGESTRLGEEEGGRARAAGGEVDPRCVDSPAAELPQASRDAALIRASRAILRDKVLRLSAGQATAEPFPSQSSISETESRTETHLLPEQPPGALQNVVLTEEVHSSAEIKHSEMWLCSEGEASLAVAAAATTEPGAKTHPNARKEELSWGREAPPKEPSAGPKPLVERKEVELVHAQSKGQPPEQAQEPQFVGGDSCDEKCTIVGRILEKKMYLQQGLHVWVQSNERLAVARKESGKVQATQNK